jgi:D,D-heptose 1,7-bisphosphate phosphatase
MNKNIKALILAAGLGTRLRPITDTIPKCLAPIRNRPILDYWLDLLGDAGIIDILINTHAFPGLVSNYVESVNSRGSFKIKESYEPVLLGSAGTLAVNKDFADDTDFVVIIYADNLTDVNFNTLIAYHESHEDPITMLLFRTEQPKSCGIVELADNNKIIEFIEKPERPKGDLANAGIYIMDASVYREIAEKHVFDLAKDALPLYVGRMRGFVHEGYLLDIGNTVSYNKAQQDAEGILAKRGYASDNSRPAVFFDRDGTLIEQVHYLKDPMDVRLLPGVTDVLKKLRKAGYCCVVVSNQAGVAKDIISLEQLEAVNREMCRQLAIEGAVIDAIYYCPIASNGNDRTVIENHDRKPGPGMIIRASNELSLRLADSWMIGDMISDILAGINAGCRGSIFVNSGKGLSGQEQNIDVKYAEVSKITDALPLIL